MADRRRRSRRAEPDFSEVKALLPKLTKKLEPKAKANASRKPLAAKSEASGKRKRSSSEQQEQAISKPKPKCKGLCKPRSSVAMRRPSSAANGARCQVHPIHSSEYKEGIFTAAAAMSDEFEVQQLFKLWREASYCGPKQLHQIARQVGLMQKGRPIRYSEIESWRTGARMEGVRQILQKPNNSDDLQLALAQKARASMIYSERQLYKSEVNGRMVTNKEANAFFRVADETANRCRPSTAVPRPASPVHILTWHWTSIPHSARTLQNLRKDDCDHADDMPESDKTEPEVDEDNTAPKSDKSEPKVGNDSAASKSDKSEPEVDDDEAVLSESDEGDPVVDDDVGLVGLYSSKVTALAAAKSWMKEQSPGWQKQHANLLTCPNSAHDIFDWGVVIHCGPRLVRQRFEDSDEVGPEYVLQISTLSKPVGDSFVVIWHARFEGRMGYEEAGSGVVGLFADRLAAVSAARVWLQGNSPCAPDRSWTCGDGENEMGCFWLNGRCGFFCFLQVVSAKDPKAHRAGRLLRA